MKHICITLLVVFALCIYTSCKQNTTKDRMLHLVKIWEQKQIIYPSEAIFTIYGKDTLINYTKSGVDYSIVSYIDSLGCLSCKLQAQAWKNFMKTIDSISKSAVPINIFVHHEANDELLSILKKENFDIPMCLDLNDSFRILNNFPADVSFRTFLLDKENRVVAIGNPIHNPKIRELYLKIIGGDKKEQEDKSKIVKTKVSINKASALLGNFDWQKEQKATFILKNAGNKPLVIEDVNTSCGCTSVDYSKEPVQSGGEIALEVLYKADRPEHFNKTITVYCNSESSPIKLTISGNAQ